MTITLGTDPEFILKDGDKFVSAIEKIKRNKKERIKSKGNEIFYDNVLAEVAVKVSNNKKDFKYNIKNAIVDLMKIIDPYQISIQACAEYSSSELSHPEAHKISCNPELCAYSLEEEKLESFPSNNRTAGGHVHIGNKDIIKGFNRYSLIRMLDLFMGVPSVLIDDDPSSVKRRSIYGLPGRFRKTPYGVEYRSLSNFWLKSPIITDWIYEISLFSTEFVLKKEHEKFWTIDMKKLFDDEWIKNNHQRDCHICHGYNLESVMDAITNSNEESAKEMFEFSKSLMPKKLIKLTEEVISKDFKDFNKEWKI